MTTNISSPLSVSMRNRINTIKKGYFSRSLQTYYTKNFELSLFNSGWVLDNKMDGSRVIYNEI